MKLLAIDPGSEESAVLVYDTLLGRPETWSKLPNDEALARVGTAPARAMAVEMVASYGMAVGKDVFETCVWIGRFIEAWHRIPKLGRPGFRPTPLRVYRRDVKLHLCGQARAKDANIRQALIDRYGPGKERAIGRKAAPGPLYGMAGDCWSALAVAVTAVEQAKII